MHLLLVISSLGGGGAERVITRLAEAWNAAGVQVTLATFDGPEGDFYSLAPGVSRRSMSQEAESISRYLPGPIRRVRWLRSVMRQVSPQAIISFTDRTNVLSILASPGLRIPVLVSERVDPEMYSPGRLWEGLRRITYPWANAIVVQTQKIKSWSERLFPQSKTCVIPNPVPTSPPNIRLVPAGVANPTILAVGRLEHQKGFDVLINAFRSLADRYPDWRLRILGEGALRDSLQNQIDSLGLTEQVELPGRCHDVLEQMACAGMYVLSSRFEGFPNTLVEAMACGRAVISTDCSTGPSDLIDSGRNGILVPVNDARGLGLAMEQLINDPQGRTRLGQAALKIRDDLSMPRILQLWNDALTVSGCPMEELLTLDVSGTRAA